MAEVSATGTYADRYGQKFQEHILAVALRMPGFVIRVRTALDHTYFHTDVHRLIARALFAFVDTYSMLPKQTTLLEHVRKLADADTVLLVEERLDKLFQDDIGDAEAVMAEAVEFGKHQALINAILASAEQIERGERVGVSKLIEDAQLVGEDILDVGYDYVGLTLDERLELYTEDVHDIVPTGMPHVDYVLEGGPYRGELHVVLAAPKKGKTSLLINIGGGSCALGANVVHYTCEIRAKKLIHRYDDWLAGPAHHLKIKNTAAYVDALADRVGKFIKGKLFIKEYPTRTLTPSMLRSHLALLRGQDFIPDVIIVDYADIMRPERRLGETRHEVAGIYEDLRKMAGQFNAVVWTASQASKAASEKASPTLEDFAEAYEKAAVIDGAIAFGQTPEEKRSGLCRLFFAGLRGQEDGSTIQCRIDRDACRVHTLCLYNFDDIQVETPYDKEDTGADLSTGAPATRVTKLREARKRMGVKVQKSPVKGAQGAKGPKRRQKGPRKRLSAVIAENK